MSSGGHLRPVQVHVLLTLLNGRCHGYGIVKDIQERTEGTLRLEPGNLYRVLRGLIARNYIRESGRDHTPESGDERRRYYEISQEGREALRLELARMKALVTAVEASLHLPMAGERES